MKIIDLLAPESISLDAAPKSKKEALDTAIALMVKSGKIRDKEAYTKTGIICVKKKARQVSEKGLLSLTENVTQWAKPGLAGDGY